MTFYVVTATDGWVSPPMPYKQAAKVATILDRCYKARHHVEPFTGWVASYGS